MSGLSESERDALRAHYVDVGRALVAPSVAERDRAGRFDRFVWKALAKAGVFGEEGIARRAVAVEGLAAGSTDAGLVVSICAHFVVVAVVEAAGTAAQKEAWLPKLRDGTWLAACANAEPGAGTDLMGLKSRARSHDGHFAISSRKRSVTNLGACDFALVSARLEGVSARESVNIFGVETDGPRRFMRRRLDLSGLRTSPTGSLLLHRAPLSSTSLVGARGDGVALFRKMFSEERVTTGFLYLGLLKACLARGMAWAETREQFGQAIGRNQYVQEKLVRMRMAIELLEAQLWRTVVAYERGDDVHASLSVVKIFGVESATTAAMDLVRLMGSRGVSQDEPAERMVRDLMALSILGGTIELQKIVIYNETAKETAKQAAKAKAAPTKKKWASDVSFVDVDAALERALVALVAEVHGDSPSLRSRWYFDTPPDRVAVARRDDVVIGARLLVVRTVLIGGREVKIGGTGAAVRDGASDEDAALVVAVVEEAQRLGCELLVSFAMTAGAEGRLRERGFRRLSARVTYLERTSGALVEERLPCAVRALSGGALVDEIEARGELHLGAGTW